MKCPECGAKNSPGSRFCEVCGAEITDVPTDGEDKRRKLKLLLILLGIAVVSFCVGLLLEYIVSDGASDDDDRKTTASEEAKDEEDKDASGSDDEGAIEPVDRVIATKGTGGETHTFGSYDAAIRMGAERIEQDVVSSADGTIYVSHSKQVSGSYVDIGDVNEGFIERNDPNILKLSEVFDRYGKDIFYVIEIKGDYSRTKNGVLALVRNYGFEDIVIIQSFDTQTLVSVKKEMPRVKTMQLCDSRHNGETVFDRALDIPQIDIISVSVDDGMMTDGRIQSAHDRGKEIGAWDLNYESTISEGIEMGLDMYFTTDPGLAISLEQKLR